MTGLDTPLTRKLDEMLKKLPREEHINHFFPTRAGWSEFEELVKWLQSKRALIESHPDSREKYNISKALLEKMERARLYDPLFDELYPDEYIEAKKSATSNKAIEEYHKGKEPEELETRNMALCRAYASFYEHTCRKYFRPLASKIQKTQIQSCGSAIQSILNYHQPMARLLSVFVPQIRNSIDHSDWHYDYQTEVIVFADRDKPDLLIPPEQLRIMCDMMIVSELCISTAIDVFHAQLWKVIAKDARKLTQYCDSLKIDQDTLLKKYVSKGVSLFQLRWMLEQVLLGQNKKPR